MLLSKSALPQVNIGYNIKISDPLVVEKYKLKNIGFSSYYLTVEPGDYRITIKPVKEHQPGMCFSIVLKSEFISALR